MGNMEITATEFAKNFGLYREVAQREPVAVMNHNRITGYFVSAKEYEQYIQLKEQSELATLRDALSVGLAQDAAGEYADYSLDELLKE